MTIRNFQAGDEAAQVALYNQAAANLSKFKPATVQEVQRRCRARDFDPTSRFYAEENGQLVGYANFNANGRVSFPWCLPGHEQHAEPLFQAMLQAMQKRGFGKIFAAYRSDWPTIKDFFLQHGFIQTREMVNWVIDLLDMPTPSARPSTSITPAEENDVPALFDLAPQMLRVASAEEFKKCLFHNPYFTPESLFVLRGRDSKTPVAVGILVTDPTYANPKAVDASMPCFRLGAFGTEHMQTKRINGLFSFLAKPDNNLPALALDLMGHAAFRLRDTDDVDCLAGQSVSDNPVYLRFYERNFRRQGSFPIFERELPAL